MWRLLLLNLADGGTNLLPDFNERGRSSSIDFNADGKCTGSSEDVAAQSARLCWEPCSGELSSQWIWPQQTLNRGLGAVCLPGNRVRRWRLQCGSNSLPGRVLTGGGLLVLAAPNSQLSWPPCWLARHRCRHIKDIENRKEKHCLVQLVNVSISGPINRNDSMSGKERGWMACWMEAPAPHRIKAAKGSPCLRCRNGPRCQKEARQLRGNAGGLSPRNIRALATHIGVPCLQGSADLKNSPRRLERAGTAAVCGGSRTALSELRCVFKWCSRWPEPTGPCWTNEPGTVSG